MTNTELLISVFKDKDLQGLKDFIIKQTIASESYEDLSSLTYATWIVSQDRLTKQKEANP
jgi:hypothetical protein